MNDRVRGLLLGLVAGDRIGGPRQMALTLAESLLETGTFDKHDIGSRYLSWWQRGGYDSGPTAAGVFRLVESGKSFPAAAAAMHAASGGMTAGCNPLQRNTVLAAAGNIAGEKLSACAKAETRLTHLHRLAGEVSSAACLLCRCLLEGDDWDLCLEKVKKSCAAAIRNAFDNKPGGTGEIYPDGYAPHVFRAAIYFTDRGSSFDDTLRQSLKFAGSANYCPVLAGSLAGARWGASRISDRWLDGVKNIGRIKDISHEFSRQW